MIRRTLLVTILLLAFHYSSLAQSKEDNTLKSEILHYSANDEVAFQELKEKIEKYQNTNNIKIVSSYQYNEMIKTIILKEGNETNIKLSTIKKEFTSFSDFIKIIEK